MISFRYHLVSIIAVFLALALGIVVGTTALNGPITKDLRHQVDSLTSDRQSLSDEVKALQGRVGDGQKFAALYGPRIVKGTLAGQNVVILGLPGASSGIKDGLANEVAAAGGTVSARIQLTGDYTDPKLASKVIKFATGGVQPIGLTYRDIDRPGAVGGALLAYVLLGKGQPTDLTQVLAGFSQMNMLKSEGGDDVKPSTYVVVAASGGLAPEDPGAQAELALVTQLQRLGAHAVVAGDNPSAEQNGVVALVRADESDSSSVTTVDNADTALGQVATVLALAEVGKPAPNTVVGHYGTANGAKALFPDPPK